MHKVGDFAIDSPRIFEWSLEMTVVGHLNCRASQRYLFMKMAYTDETPEDYEPPYFQAEGDSEPAHFHRRPFSM